MSPSRLQVFAGGAAVAAIAAVAVIVIRAEPETSGENPPTRAAVSRPEPEREVQQGPLPDDARITLQEAKSRSPYDLAIPPTSNETGDRTGIWIDGTLQIAFVWSTDMTFYVARTELREEEASQEWAAKVAEQPDEGWELTTVRGHAALAKNAGGEVEPSSLTWIERGLTLQFVAPAHTLEQLRQFAEGVEFEQ